MSVEIVREFITADPGRAHRGVSHREIADETGLSVGQVKYALRRMREDGEIEVTTRWEGDFYYNRWGDLYGSWYRSGNGYELVAR